MSNKRDIKEQLESTERCLANAEEYLAQGRNVEGFAWLHLDDWNGKSGHPLWVKNFMIPTIPTTKKAQAKMEKTLETIESKKRDKSLKHEKRQKGR